MTLTEIAKNPELEQLKKELKDKRIASAKELIKIKDAVVIDRSMLHYGVLSVDKKNPNNKRYYHTNLNHCDCFDFSKFVELDDFFMCKHMRTLELAINRKIPVRKVDLKSLLVKESL